MRVTKFTIWNKSLPHYYAPQYIVLMYRYILKTNRLEMYKSQ